MEGFSVELEVFKIIFHWFFLYDSTTMTQWKGATKMVQRAKTLAAKPGNQSSILRTNVRVEAENCVSACLFSAAQITKLSLSNYII